MYFKQKLVYMGFGCLFTLVGYILANLGGDVIAQSELTVVDEIVCRKLRVVDSQGRTVAVLKENQFGDDIFSVYNTGDKVVRIGANSNGGYMYVNHASGEVATTVGISHTSKEGFVQIKGKDGKGFTQLTTDEDGGIIMAKGKDGISYVQLAINKDGGVITVKGKDGESGVKLFIDKYGGGMATFNKGGENVLQAGVGDMGGGIITTWDKLGYRTGRLP